MISISTRRQPNHGGRHVRVRVFVGPDEEHRAFVGILTFLPEEADEFIRRVEDQRAHEFHVQCKSCKGSGSAEYEGWGQDEVVVNPDDGKDADCPDCGGFGTVREREEPGEVHLQGA